MGLIVRHTPPYTLVQGDAVRVLEQMDSESVDLIVTDPAYESLEKHRAKGTTTRLKQSKSSSNPWFRIFPNTRFPELFVQMHRVLKRNTHLYLFCDPETAFIVKPMGEAAGFRFWKPLIWDKQRIGMGYHYRSRYEFILFFEKGKRKLRDLGIPDILEVARIAKGYPSEKPWRLCQTLISQSTDEGALVCDPFTGSSSVGHAASSLNREFFGIDISNDAMEWSRERLRVLEWKSPLKPAS